MLTDVLHLYRFPLRCSITRAAPGAPICGQPARRGDARHGCCDPCFRSITHELAGVIGHDAIDRLWPMVAR